MFSLVLIKFTLIWITNYTNKPNLQRGPNYSVLVIKLIHIPYCPKDCFATFKAEDSESLF